MPGWRAAHRIAMFAASKAHAAYGVDTDNRIDVFHIIADAGILLAFQPMQKLSGAVVLEPGAPPGIIINANHPLSRQRYTAAHELGHYFMHHGASIDPDHDLFRDGMPMTEKEMVAEAFAAWFLMPKALVENTLQRMGKKRLESPLDAYELSLRLGTSYESTVLHAGNLRLAAAPRIRGWLREKPATLKKTLAGALTPEDMKSDVWLFGESDQGCDAVVRPGDRLFLTLREIPSSGWRWRPIAEPHHAALLGKHYDYLDDAQDEHQVIGAPTNRTFVYTVPPAEAAVSDTLSLINGPSWREQADREFHLKLSIEPPRQGFSADNFLVDGIQN
jgi:IrrE N-terminal-like domain